MQKRNRYRNPVRPTVVLRIVFFCLFAAVVGGAFVFVRNRHVQQGDEIHRLESVIADLEHEMQLWELRNAGAKDRIELGQRLDWIGSDLEPIDPERVLEIRGAASPVLGPDIAVAE